MNRSFVRIEFTEDSGVGVVRLAAESETTADDLRASVIGEDIGSALVRCGAPRAMLILATAVMQSGMTDHDIGGHIDVVTRDFVEAATRLVQAWHDFDRGVNGRHEITGQPRF